MILEFHDEDNILNKRSEMVNKCRHQNKFVLKNFKTNKTSNLEVGLAKQLMDTNG